MSRQSAVAFLERLSSDEEFASEVKETLASTEGEERRDAISDLGYDFSDEELRKALEETDAEQKSGELSEEELESVAGGTLSFEQSYSFESADGTDLTFEFDGSEDTATTETLDCPNV